MAKTKPNKVDRDALLRAQAHYTDEKNRADQAIADERATGVPANTVNFSLRLPTDIAVQMRKAAAAEHLHTSVWLRRLIINTLNSQEHNPSDEHIERVVRRILAEHKTT